ncbi:MAG: hypothetical protein WA012_16675 [Rhodoferax sp.]|jgi:hypothetical protein|uniref:hypothetical protein n=1 Tax=Rhodoferax sp. TaxID=50421 RepID=UPI003BB19DB9
MSILKMLEDAATVREENMPRNAILPSTRTTVACLAVAVGLLACATPEVRWVTDSETRFERNGISFLPPSGENWAHAQSGPYGAAFGKLVIDAKGEPRTLIMAVINGQLKEKKYDLKTEGGFRQAVEYFVKDGAQSGFKVSKAQYSPAYRDQDTDCMKFESSIEQSNSPVHPGEVLLIEGKGIVCRHPTSPDYLVTSTFSERRKLGRDTVMNDELWKEVEHSMSSVRFTPMK